MNIKLRAYDNTQGAKRSCSLINSEDVVNTDEEYQQVLLELGEEEADANDLVHIDTNQFPDGAHASLYTPLAPPSVRNACPIDHKHQKKKLG